VGGGVVFKGRESILLYPEKLGNRGILGGKRSTTKRKKREKIMQQNVQFYKR